MTYAIIEAGGTQLKVEPGRFYDINLLPVEAESNYTVDKVLLVNNDDEITVGQPYIEGATVEGTVLRHRRGKKVIVYKMQPKKKTRKKRGHRQELSRLMINSISIGGSVIATAPETAVATAPETTEVTDDSEE
ncbi:MAG: 50S ribosomal protein L21 [Xenococcus sp. MO_188.B8]|nr:50S ribosomal protein L21 [Xenococcus sp. MO_188.B8]